MMGQSVVRLLSIFLLAILVVSAPYCFIGCGGNPPAPGDGGDPSGTGDPGGSSGGGDELVFLSDANAKVMDDAARSFPDLLKDGTRAEARAELVDRLNNDTAGVAGAKLLEDGYGIFNCVRQR